MSTFRLNEINLSSPVGALKTYMFGFSHSQGLFQSKWQVQWLVRSLLIARVTSVAHIAQSYCQSHLSRHTFSSRPSPVLHPSHFSIVCQNILGVASHIFSNAIQLQFAGQLWMKFLLYLHSKTKDEYLETNKIIISQKAKVGSVQLSCLPICKIILNKYLYLSRVQHRFFLWP